MRRTSGCNHFSRILGAIQRQRIASSEIGSLLLRSIATWPFRTTIPLTKRFRMRCKAGIEAAPIARKPPPNTWEYSYTAAGTANLSSDPSSSHSDAPVTALAGRVEIPSFRIFVMRVVLARPSLAAAPFRPPTTPLVSRRVLMMTARCASFSVRTTPSRGSWLQIPPGSARPD